MISFIGMGLPFFGSSLVPQYSHRGIPSAFGLFKACSTIRFGKSALAGASGQHTNERRPRLIFGGAIDNAKHLPESARQLRI